MCFFIDTFFSLLIFLKKLHSDLNLVQQGMGDKVALTIMSFSTLLFSIGIAFYHGWELTLVTMSIMPVLGIAFAAIGKVQVRFAASESNAYGKAGAIAEEVINLIRYVLFNIFISFKITIISKLG